MIGRNVCWLLFTCVLSDSDCGQDSKKIDEKDEKIIRESIPLTSSAAPLNTFVALDESDIQILKTYVRVHLCAFRRRDV